MKWTIQNFYTRALLPKGNFFYFRVGKKMGNIHQANTLEFPPI